MFDGIIVEGQVFEGSSFPEVHKAEEQVLNAVAVTFKHLMHRPPTRDEWVQIGFALMDAAKAAGFDPGDHESKTGPEWAEYVWVAGYNAASR